jgi:hypothetical protein
MPIPIHMHCHSRHMPTVLVNPSLHCSHYDITNKVSAHAVCGVGCMPGPVPAGSIYWICMNAFLCNVSCQELVQVYAAGIRCTVLYRALCSTVFVGKAGIGCTVLYCALSYIVHCAQQCLWAKLALGALSYIVHCAQYSVCGQSWSASASSLCSVSVFVCML